jgi:multiple sugar transport system permease protein
MWFSSDLKLKLMVLPASLYILLLTLYPLYKCIELAFSKMIIQGGKIITLYAGLENFVRVFNDAIFYKSLEITLIFTVFSVVIELILGLLLAVIVASSKYSRIIVPIILTSMVMPPVTVALIWRFMFYPNIGLFDNLVRMITGYSIPWLGDPFWARISIIIVDVWHWTSFVFLLIYAGYVSLPTQYFEAASIDGGSDFQIFRHITLPLLKPTIALATLFRVIDVLQAFPELWQLTFGGPVYSTTILNILVYLATFNFHDLGYASVVSIILVLAAFFATVLYSKFRRG